MYVFGFLFVYWYARKCLRENKIRITEEQLDNIMAWLTVALIAGARLFDVIFWDFAYFTQHPLKIFAIWEGGLSFHGGLAGVIIATYLLCKKYNIKFLNFADVFAVPLSLAQVFGRIGNFINAELYGFPTKLPWGVNFGSEVDILGNAVFRHPAQLYEVFYNLVIFAVLWKLKDKKIPQGYLFAVFLVLYSIFRSITELIRVQDVAFGQITMGHILNIPLFAIGIWLVIKLKRN